LLAQAEVLAPDADELLGRIGMAAGASTIDVACGVLGILSQLRSRVGEAGRVVGPHIEPRLLALAGKLAAQQVSLSRPRRSAQPAPACRGIPLTSCTNECCCWRSPIPEDVVAEMTRIASALRRGSVALPRTHERTSDGEEDGETGPAHDTGAPDDQWHES
jgi:hypothetical protein